MYLDHRVVVLAGGSGLFIKALCEGLDKFPEVPVEFRKKIEGLYREKGLEYLQEYLQRVDPVYFGEVDRQNPHRLIRALSVFEASGMPFSSFRKGASVVCPFKPVYLLLNPEREELYRRIDLRVVSKCSKRASGGGARAVPFPPAKCAPDGRLPGVVRFFSEGATTLENAVS